jgi:L-alanine-DL-glutamate epimerase-like enolase superfamily enzyme
MKVTKFISHTLSIPLRWPFNGVFPGKRVNPVIVRLFTDSGLEGFGLGIAWNDRNVKALKESIDGLSEIIIGQDIFRGAEAWQKLWKASKWMGHQGYGIYAFSAIDTALWNLKAQALNLPLAHLLGGNREEVPAYASHLLFRNWTLDELQRDAAALVQQGFKMMKMNMGGQSLKTEVERIKAVRGAVGKEIGILVDANWSWSVAEAIRIGRAIEPYDVYWLEDPLASDEANDLAEVKGALDIPIVAGETKSLKQGFRPLIEKRGIDILMIDLQCVGGVTEWIKVAAMAEGWNLPVCSHLFHDYSIHLVAAVPNGTVVEYMPWWDEIYKEPPQVINGMMKVPNKPGLGFELDMEKLKYYEFK